MVEYQCQGGQVYHQWQCCTNPPGSIGGRGVTYWGFPINSGHNATIWPYQSETLTFTCSAPTCFSDKDACIAYFNAYIDATVTPIPNDVEIKFHLNDEDEISGIYLSGVYQHGAQQAFDFAFAPNDAFHAGGKNTFVMENKSGYPIYLEDFKILRVYQMCKLNEECEGSCDIGGVCEPQINWPATGNLDTDDAPYIGRRDFPCNSEVGGSISFTFYNNTDYGHTTLPAGNTVEFTFDWTNHSACNYLQGTVCFFNFNQMFPATTTDETDVTLTAYINGNGTPFATYYLNPVVNRGLFPSYDLMQANGYDDDGANTIKLVNNSTVPVYFNDPWGINIYRTYKTGSVLCYCCETCEMCQTACEITCQTGCEVSCQTACQISCQTGCQVTCQTGCEVACQTGCEVSCQTACEIACQGCQEPCQVSCQPGCQTSCQICYLCITCYSCFVMCQEMCQISCQEGCELCQEACQVACQDACQVACQDACQITCQGCQGCETCVTCQMLETCPIVYYTCQSCQTCQPAYT